MHGRLKKPAMFCYALFVAGAIFWASVVGVLVGVGTTCLFSLSTGFMLAVGTIGILLIVHNTRLSAVAGLSCLAFFVGGLRMHYEESPRSTALDSLVGTSMNVHGEVVREPDVREDSIRLSVKTPDGSGVLVIAPLHTRVSYGDLITATGALRLPERFETGGAVFEYPLFLAREGIGYEMAFADVSVESAGRWSLMRGAIAVKHWYLSGLSIVLPEPMASLAGGLTVGDKRGLGEELSNAFQTVGLMHIVVLSGYNIMVVMRIFDRLLITCSPRIRFMSSCVVAVSFALLTGFAASSVRAAIMAIIGAAGTYLHRVYLAGRALGFVALCMVLWNPLILLYDPGFQLSVIATAGLLLFSSRLSDSLSWITERGGVREIVVSTLSTQVAVMPLVLHLTGAFSLSALPVNIFTLVIVPYAMICAFVAGIGGILLGSFGVVLALPAYLLLSYIINVAEFVAHIPYASLQVGAPSFLVMIIAYVLMMFIFLTVARRTASEHKEKSGARSPAKSP